jgi:hypothetical protein
VRFAVVPDEIETAYTAYGVNYIVSCRFLNPFDVPLLLTERQYVRTR